MRIFKENVVWEMFVHIVSHDCHVMFCISWWSLVRKYFVSTSYCLQLPYTSVWCPCFLLCAQPVMKLKVLCLVLSFLSHLYIACRLVSKLQEAGGFPLASEQVKKLKGTTAGSTASPMQSRRARRKSGIFNTNVSNVSTYNKLMLEM